MQDLDFPPVRERGRGVFSRVTVCGWRGVCTIMYVWTVERSRQIRASEAPGQARGRALSRLPRVCRALYVHPPPHVTQTLRATHTHHSKMLALTFSISSLTNQRQTKR